MEVFSELGFEGASTRTIVERAQANLVSIPYYFGSKLGLYHAAAEYIGSNIAERFRPACERARQGLLEAGLVTHEETLREVYRVHRGVRPDHAGCGYADVRGDSSSTVSSLIRPRHLRFFMRSLRRCWSWALSTSPG